MLKLLFLHCRIQPMKLTYLLPLTVILCFSCNKNQQMPAESASVPPEREEIVLEDPFSGTNLVDNIKLIDLDNNPIDLSKYGGKRIFLNFWATWCKPCIIEMPSIERAQQQLSEEDFVFLLASDETVGRINRFKATKDFDLEFVRVETPFPDLGILSLPTTLVIDENGKIALNQIGALEWDAPEVIEKLRSIEAPAVP